MRVKEPDGSFRVWAVLYQQYDGYFEWLGAQLCKLLSNMTIMNGYEQNKHKFHEVANGPGCLFAQIISYFKVDIGGAYLCDPNDYQLQGYNYYIDVVDDDIHLTVDGGGGEYFEGTFEEFQKKYDLNIDIKSPQEAIYDRKTFVF